MTVTRWSFPGSKNPLFLKEEYIRSFRECASHITGRLGMQILVFPQVTGPSSYSDDRIFAKEIFGPLENQDIVLLNEHYEPDKLKGIMAHMTVFVGTRMHSNIFSLSAKVPTMAIAYQEKTTGIMEMLGLGDWVIPINDVSPKKMINMFSDLLHHRDFLKEKLIDVMPKIELSASAAADVCKKVYDMKM
ncbi:MAG TPA: hypothetical protein DEG92_02970 [Rikenellaceae bacterium]|nr:hypothetical protein [Rikenellaceae bacterium]